MGKMNALDWVSFVLVVIGGINWGLVGFFQFDLVATLFGGMASLVARVVYSLVGVAALYALIAAFMKHKGDSSVTTAPAATAPAAA